MPLTQPQIDQINAVLEQIRLELHPIVKAQSRMMWLLDVHQLIDHDPSLTALIAAAKTDARTAANDLVTYLDGL